MALISAGQALKKGTGKASLRGWIHRERKQADKVFLMLRDSSGVIQAVVDKAKVSKEVWKNANKLVVESSLYIEGELAKDERAPGGAELRVSDIDIIQIAERFPITKDFSPEFLLDQRHLWLRSRKMNAIMKIRSTVFGAIHEYFRKQGFYEFQSPVLTPLAGESGSTMFKVDYFGEPIYLAQTWQLYAEAGIFSLEKIYCIAPSFRAEKSKTSRHLTEYWHAEMEAAWMNFDELEDAAEELVKHILKKVLDENRQELEILGRNIDKLKPSLKKKFPRMTYADVIKLLKEKKKMAVPWGKDLRTIEEDKITELYDTPIIVTRYPKVIKAFYMKEDPKDPKVVLGFDMLAPEGYGELVGASQREENNKKIIENLKHQGEDPGKYGFYLDLRKYGSMPHAGFGLGVERVVSWICGLDNIKDAIPFQEQC